MRITFSKVTSIKYGPYTSLRTSSSMYRITNICKIHYLFRTMHVPCLLALHVPRVLQVQKGPLNHQTVFVHLPSILLHIIGIILTS